MRDPVNISELAQNSPSGVEGYREEALTSLVEDLMGGGKVNGLGLQDFLESVPDLAERVSAAAISHDWAGLHSQIEYLLSWEFEDSDAVSDRCWELDQDARERAKERE